MKSNVFIILAVTAVTLLAVGMWFGISGTETTYWAETKIACLPSGHESVKQHLHADLTIFVNGKKEEIPAHIGITEDCMAEVHTHDVSGEIHIETAKSGRTFTLVDFFAVWGKTLELAGKKTMILVNGETVDSPRDVVLADGAHIEVHYISEGEVNYVQQVEARVGENKSAFGVTITPLEVLEDSRCPEDVVCVWAGTVRIRTNLVSGLGSAEGSEQEFELGVPITTETESVTLVQVEPHALSDIAIPVGAYRFTFEIAKRASGE